MILPLEQQVVSLESAKRLKELGFPQESLFYWGKSQEFEKEHSIIFRQYYYVLKDSYSAYTTAELGEMLPHTCTTYKDALLPWCCLFKSENGKHIQRERALTEAEARAKMLIYLKSNGLI